MTRAELARRCGVSLPTVSRWYAIRFGLGRKPTTEAMTCLIANLSLTELEAETLWTMWKVGDQRMFATVLRWATEDPPLPEEPDGDSAAFLQG